jgi:hypothetical protein
VEAAVWPDKAGKLLKLEVSPVLQARLAFWTSSVLLIRIFGQYAVATLAIVTLAPMTTAPEGSLTVPTMLPVSTVACANNKRAAVTSVKRRKAKIRGAAAYKV